MQRRDFFKNILKKENSSTFIIRPPYGGVDSDYSQCLECGGKCAKSCEEGIIVLLQDNSPSLDFSKGGCTYCDACANVCEYGVLSLEDKKQIDVDIIIDPKKCMSWSKSICFSCKDPCLDNAIEFTGMFYPEIIADKCSSCGFCIKYCPTEAIVVVKRDKKDEKI